MLADLCESLARHGHEPHVYCSRGKYDDGTHVGETTPKFEKLSGVTVHRVSAGGFGKGSMIGRVIDYLCFHVMIGLKMMWCAGVRRRYDVVVTLTTPPLIGVYAPVARWLSRGRLRHVCWVMDLHPDCEFELGVFDRKKCWARGFAWLNDMHLRQADQCVVLGDCMAKRLQDKRVDAARLTTISVWGHEHEQHDDQVSDVAGDVAGDDDGIAAADTTDDATQDMDRGERVNPVHPVHPVSRVNPWQDTFEVGERFVVMYSGNAGLIHTFEAIIEAAVRLRDRRDIVFLFVGGGPRLQEVRRAIEEHDLDNIVLQNYVPREQLGDSLALGDVHLVSLRNNMSGVAVPSKLYGIMAASRPAILVGPMASASGCAIRDHNCGYVIDPDGDDATGELVTALEKLAGDRALCDQLGRNARQAYDDDYNPSACCKQWRNLLAPAHA